MQKGRLKQKKKKERKMQKEEEEQKERKRTVWITKENVPCSNFRPLIYVKVNPFNILQLT